MSTLSLQQNQALAHREPITDIFGTNVFNITAMRERLAPDIFKKMMDTIERGERLDPLTADVVANAMKEWAVEKGATHYCHWFQPLTGMTAEKHDAFIAPRTDGQILLEFSGKDLIQGEPDASSFPGGGLRESFEARGYTVWDCTSPVFVKNDGDNICMFIPSAFCSYNGDAMDYKAPLLRSMDALNKQALRVLRALGNKTTQKVTATLGGEQEYFLIDKDWVTQRLDLMQTGRTLYGAPSPKGMAMSVHYFGSVHEKVASFMNELNQELWKLGVSAKTQHNEISPCQYEIAPIFAQVNVGTDHNQLTMEALQKIAERHDMECLLHEKPFATLGGSGKHVNWSMSTDDGINLLDPGKTPHDNEVFLVFLCAVIKAVDKYAALLRASVADAGNDHRLGAMEAPPAIISIFLGSQLTDILEKLGRGEKAEEQEIEEILLGVKTLPPLPKDVTDRNRTSPFAFTGNRFEFRMPGSALTTARPSFVLCTIVADTLKDMADDLEKADNIKESAKKILKNIIKEHDRVIFNGDNYSQEWVDEAGRRGMPNLKDTVDAFNAIRSDEIVELFSRHKVLDRQEMEARIEITFQRYAQCILIEGRTALRMAQRQIMPAAIEYSRRLAEACHAVKQAGGKADTQVKTMNEICELIDTLRAAMEGMTHALAEVEPIPEAAERALQARNKVIPQLVALREPADKLETLVDAELWPLPTYAEMVFKR